MNTTGFFKLGVKIKNTRLTPIAVISKKYGRAGVWYRAVCECGKIVEPSPSAIRTGMVRSCGCYKADCSRARKTHGLSKRPEYFAAWQAFRRCNNRREPSYSRYGGIGIRVKFKDANAMAAWLVAEMPKPKGKLVLDRIDNRGHYAPGNLRWATPRESANNRRCTQFVEIKGVRKSIQDWSRETGIGYMTIRGRIKSGFPKALWLFKGKITKAVLFGVLNSSYSS